MIANGRIEMRVEVEMTGPPAAAPQAPLVSLHFVRLARVSTARIGAALQSVGLRPPEFAILEQLSASGALSQLGLAQLVQIHPSNLVALLDGLEDNHFLSRERDPADRRRHVLTITPAGERIVVAGRAATEEAERSILAPLAPEERALFLALLGRVTANACAERCWGGGR